MQKNQFKIIPIFLILTSIVSFSAFGQAFLRDLEIADSLFKEKKFTESFEIYKAIHETGEYASPAMLLKMAYIKEGLGDDASALYYLNSYYLQTKNDKVFLKMEKLAKKNDLDGYEYTDKDWFLNIYFNYYHHLLVVLMIIVTFLSSFILYMKIKKGTNAYSAGFGILLAGFLLFLIVNFNTYKRGVLVKNNSYIMNAPSASADVLDIYQAGHRVKILGQEDIWTKIQWDNRIGYIKKDYLKQLTF